MRRICSPTHPQDDCNSYNEKTRLAERQLSFDTLALKEVIATTVGQGIDDVQSVRKIAEGGFNRVLDVTMRDGFQVVARLPYPCTQPKYLATASETATMDLLRSNGLQVPLVYGYRADRDNSLGTEYIIMEKVPGQNLGPIWPTLSDKKRIKVLEQIVEAERKLFDIRFPAYGSVYYSAEMPRHMHHVELEQDKRFCIGPDTSLGLWYGTRSLLGLYRGAASTPREVFESAARKELAWLQEYGRPRMPFEREYREAFSYHEIAPADHIRSLKILLDVAVDLVPSQNFLSRAVLRHPDLNLNNIFIDEECNITSILDWQHSAVLPLFLSAGIPTALQNWGDPVSDNMEEPGRDPDTNDEEDYADDDVQGSSLYRRRNVHHHYLRLIRERLEPHYQAITHDKGQFRRRIYRHAAAPWEGNNVPLKIDLIELSRGVALDERPRIPLDESEIESTLEIALALEKIDREMHFARAWIGTSTDGLVSHERYEQAMARARELKEDALREASSDFEREMVERHWPFDDHDEAC